MYLNDDNHRSQQKQPKNEIEAQLLQAILSDNKKLTKQFKVQLDTIEKLQNDNETLKKRVNDIFMESSLCIDRDEMNMKRNVLLLRENKELKQRVKELSHELYQLKHAFQNEVENMKQSFDQQCEEMIWRNDRLDMNVIKLQSDLEQSNKDKKWLYDDNKRLKRLISNINTTNQSNTNNNFMDKDSININ